MVTSGACRTVVGGVAIEWSAVDMFAVPSWAAVDHEVGEPSDLFWLSDGPTVEALRLYRPETLAEYREVRLGVRGVRDTRGHRVLAPALHDISGPWQL